MKTLNVLTLVELASSYAIAKDIQYTYTDAFYVSLKNLCKFGTDFEKEHPEFIFDYQNNKEENDWIENSTNGHIKITYNENWDGYMVIINGYDPDFYPPRAVEPLVDFIRKNMYKKK